MIVAIAAWNNSIDFLFKGRMTDCLFINDSFCCILDAETDEKLYFFGYTMIAPPRAKEGEKPPKPRYCTVKINTIRYSFLNGEKQEEIEKVPIRVICDENDNIITDLKLLEYLYHIRFVRQFPVMITNNALVSMATYMPSSKEEFIALNGLGEGIYRVCGEEFISAIQDYIEF